MVQELWPDVTFFFADPYQLQVSVMSAKCLQGVDALWTLVMLQLCSQIMPFASQTMDHILGTADLEKVSVMKSVGDTKVRPMCCIDMKCFQMS